MPAKVFISCGQANQSEIQFAGQLSGFFKSRGFETFVAGRTQSIQDVNNAILWNLRTSDYYVFVDFKRERLFANGHLLRDLFKPRYRGSLFTHQELGISYLLGFPEAIFLQERGVHREGLLAFILGNAEPFKSTDEAINLITAMSDKWDPTFTRGMEIKWIPLLGPFYYGDHSTPPPGRYSHIGKISVRNKRIDIPAINTIARLEKITDPSGAARSPDRSSLKWAGEQGYSKMIVQQDSSAFDAFGILDNNPLEVYLHSASDLFPRAPIISGPAGKYVLRFSVFAVGFPKCEACIELNLTGAVNTTTVTMLYSGHYRE